MRKINLLYVITKLELGGAQKQLLSLLDALDKEKFQPFLFTAREGLLVTDAASINGLTLHLSCFLERPPHPLRDLLSLIELYRFIRRHKIDIVHTHSSKAGVVGRLAARLAGVRVIVHTVHGWSFNDFQARALRRLYIWLERVGALVSSKIIVVSEWDKRKGLREGIGKEEEYELIPYGINYAEFQGDGIELRDAFGVSSAGFLVGMIACLKPQKAPLDFVALAKKLTIQKENVKCILVGDGVLRPAIQRLIRKYHLEEKVILTGWRKDIPQILSALDVVVLTSLWEGMPIVALEAMASAKPVVVTQTGGVSEVIKEGETGFLVDPSDIAALCDKVSLLLADEPLRKRVGAQARLSLKENFSIAHMCVNTQKLYFLLLNQQR